MIWLAIIVALVASPAAADPLSGLIIGALGGSAAIGAVGVALVRVGVGLAVSQLSKAILGKGKAPSGVGDPGIRTQSTTTGGINSQSLIVGRYLTAGNLAAPRMSHGSVGDTPNAYRTHVYDLCDMKVQSLVSIMVDDVQIDLGDMSASGSGYGLTPNGGPYKDRLWVDFNNDETVANAILLDKYGSRGTRPWTSDMVGRGLAYAVMTFQYDREVYQADPRVAFVVDGMMLYDPRLDSSVGGNGAHRYGTPSTHTFSRNPVVMIYNILRGIQVTDDLLYGLGVGAADLPLDVWAAAMTKAEAGPFQAGYEIKLAEDEPLDIIDELLKTCDADIADVGGTWYIRVGGASLPVAFITDEDILRSKPQDLDPFPSLAETYNGVAVSFISPATRWQPIDAPPRYDLVAEAEDGRRLVADVSLPAVTSMTQAQRLSRAWLLDARRMRRHNIALGPEGLLYKPLDTISWSSDRNGYVLKWFEINQRGIDTVGLCCTFSLRERDPADYDWQPSFEIPTTAPSSNVTTPSPQVLPNFALAPYQIHDDQGQRRPALLMSWSGNLPDVDAIRWTLRVKSNGLLVANGSTHDVAANQLAVTDGILPAVEYEARARMVTDRPTEWTPWVSAITSDIRLGAKDISDAAITAQQLAAEITAQIDAAEATADQAAADVLVVQQSVNTVQGEVDANLTAAQAEFADIDTQITTITSNVGANAAAISTETAARATEDAALAGRIDTIKASFNQVRYARAFNFDRDLPGVSAVIETVGAASTYEATNTAFRDQTALTITATSAGRAIYRHLAATDGVAIVGPATIRARAMVRFDGTNTPTIRVRMGYGADFQDGIVSYANGTLNPIPAASGSFVAVTMTTALPAGAYLKTVELDTIGSDNSTGLVRVADLVFDEVTEKVATEALITDEAIARADADSAIAGTVATVSASIGDLSAEVTDLSTAYAETDGKVRAIKGLSATTIDVNGTPRVASIRLTSYADPDGTGGTAIQLDAQNTIVNGTLSTDKLVVGLGQNLFPNSNFAQGVQEFYPFGNGAYVADMTVSLRPAGATYTGLTTPTLQIMASKNGTVDDSAWAEIRTRTKSLNDSFPNLAIPIQPNKYYEWSFYGWPLNGKGKAGVIFYDINGNFIAPIVYGAEIVSSGASRNPDSWSRAHVMAQAPGTAVAAQPVFRLTGDAGGSGSAWLFVHKPMFAQTHQYAAAPSGYSTGGTTMITGDSIYSNTVIGRHFVAGGITAADAIFANAAIVEADIANAAITSAKISNAAITNAKIANAAITTAKIDDLAVNTLKIAGYSATIMVFADGSLKTGNNTFIKAATAVMTLPETGDIFINWGVRHFYSANPGWGFKILVNGAQVDIRDNMSYGNDYPSGAWKMSGVSGTKTVDFYWKGASSAIQGSVDLQLIGRMR